LANEITLPVWAIPVWEMFIDLTRTRNWNEGIPRPITAVEIKAHCELSKIDISAVEYKLLIAIDNEYMKDGR